MCCGSAVPDGSKVMTRLEVILWSSSLEFGRESDNSLHKNTDVEESSERIDKQKTIWL